MGRRVVERSQRDGKSSQSRAASRSPQRNVSNAVMGALRFPAGLALVNLLVLLSSLLVVTWLAAAIAGYASVRAFVGQDDKIARTYLHTFRIQLPQRMFLGLVFGLGWVLVVVNISFLMQQRGLVALPLVLLNAGFAAGLACATTALIRHLAGAPETRVSWPLIRRAALEGTRMSLSNAVTLTTCIAALWLALQFPLIALFYCPSGLLLVLALLEKRELRMNRQERIPNA